MKLPLKDAAGSAIGILVMEIPYTSVASEKEAIQEAEGIRQELARESDTTDTVELRIEHGSVNLL